MLHAGEQRHSPVSVAITFEIEPSEEQDDHGQWEGVLEQATDHPHHTRVLLHWLPYLRRSEGIRRCSAIVAWTLIINLFLFYHLYQETKL